MSSILRLLTPFLLTLLLIPTLGYAQIGAPPVKKFKRALVIGGGGISPGVALGIIAGARAAGYEPDVIIATCGATLGATVAQAIPNPERALAFIKSPRYHQTISTLAQIDTYFALSLKMKLDGAAGSPGLLPPVFDGNILLVPETLGALLPSEKFTAGPTRLIVTGSRARFGPPNVGAVLTGKSAFKQVFFTDPDTAGALRGMPSYVRRLFPAANLDSGTEVNSHTSLSQAMRASIADPFLVNPAKVGGQYYFTGAVDLFPIETAQAIAEEVLVTYPSGQYSEYEDLAVSSTFGFKQSARSREASRHTRVKWIDVAGINEVTMDPEPAGLIMVSRIPSSHAAWAAAIDRQYSFGYWRAVEAVKIQRNVGNVRTHLRVR